MNPTTQEKIIQYFCRKTFPFWQKFGINVIPNHYYQPIPDLTTLNDDVWDRNSSLFGIDIHEEEQIKLLSEFKNKYKAEYEKIPLYNPGSPYEYYYMNKSFELIDGVIFYCMLRHFRPKNVIEIGSGNSTLLIAQALLQNEKEYQNKTKFVAYEPYPNEILKKGFPGLTKLETTRIEEIPLEVFSNLDENDILFIDSSHVLKIGSDVQYEYLELLPRLNKGVIVHVHDIFLPKEYPQNWVRKKCRFWNEQYLLHAFLMFNEKYDVLWAGNYMHINHLDILEESIPMLKMYAENPGVGSFWFQRKV